MTDPTKGGPMPAMTAPVSILDLARSGRYRELAEAWKAPRAKTLAPREQGREALVRAQMAWEFGLGEEARGLIQEARHWLLGAGEPREVGLAYLWYARILATFGARTRGVIALDKARGILAKAGAAEDHLLLDRVEAELGRTDGPAVQEGRRRAEARARQGDEEWLAWYELERVVACAGPGGGAVSQAHARALEARLEAGPGGAPLSPDLEWRIRALLGSLPHPAGEDSRARDFQTGARAVMDQILEELPAELRTPFLDRPDRARHAALLPRSSVATDAWLEDHCFSGREIRGLFRSIHALNRDRNLQSLLRTILDALVETVGAESGLLVLCEGEKVEWSIGRGANGVSRPLTDLPAAMGYVRRAIERGEAVRALDPEAESGGSGDPDAVPAGTRSLLCLPLRFLDRTLGAVHLERRGEPGGFTDVESRLAELLANQAAVALEHSLLVAKSSLDPLTGSATHAHFERRTAEEVERSLRHGRPCGLLMVDLDHFKKINDTYGHEAGSRLLRKAADVMRRALRLGDVTGRAPGVSLVGRYGGDEFEVLLPDTTREGLARAAERLLRALRETRFECGETRVEITASIGGAACPDDARSVEELVLRADEALYEAKRRGRNRVRLFGDPGAAPARTEEEVRALSRHGRDVLERLTQILDASGEPQETLNTALKTIVEVAGAERGFILLFEGNDRIRLRSAFNVPEEQLTAERFRVSFGLLTQALRDGRPMRIEHVGAHPKFLGHDSVRDLGLSSFVAVPIRRDGYTLGLIYLDSTIHNKSFTSEDEVLLVRFADFMARALDLSLAARQRSLQLERLDRVLRAGLKDLEAQWKFDALIGEGQAMRDVRLKLEHIARFSYPVLVLGETGTGKEVVARALHANGPRAESPLVSVNCAALSRELLESELFGHVKGSFTGADRDRPGLFSCAHQGTLFLDEIAETPEDLQRKLLRVLQEGEFTPVGSSQTQKCDVRIVAATHRDLEREVREGRFREDLYYRLNVFRVTLPALRERSEDVPLLARHFLDAAVRECGTAPRTLAAETAAALRGYSWPGNVRELRNAMRHAVAFSTDVVRIEDLPPEIAGTAGRIAFVGPTGPVAVGAGEKPIDGFWRQMITAALQETRGNRSAAAELLGISRWTLTRKLRAFGMDADDAAEPGKPRPTNSSASA